MSAVSDDEYSIAKVYNFTTLCGYYIYHISLVDHIIVHSHIRQRDLPRVSDAGLQSDYHQIHNTYIWRAGSPTIQFLYCYKL